MRSVIALLSALTFLTLAATVADAQARRFRVRDDGGSRITFTSDAPLETINGVSSRVSGSVRFDPANLGSARGRVQVPIASLRSGIDLRDEHLRSDTWLDADSHPNGIFEITSVRGAQRLSPNQEARVTVAGRFTIHGVTRRVTADARVKWIPLTDEMRSTPGIDGDVLRVRARFTIRLSEFGVEIPTVVRLKVSNEITVTANLRAIAES